MGGWDLPLAALPCSGQEWSRTQGYACVYEGHVPSLPCHQTLDW